MALEPDAWPDMLLALAALAPLAAVELAKSLRWGVLMGAPRPGFWLCLRAVVAGQATNALAPLRAGEAVRLGLIKLAGASALRAGVALAAAKAIDALCLAAIAAAVVGTAVIGDRPLALVGAAAVVVGGTGVVLARERGREWLAARSFPGRRYLLGLLAAADQMRDRRTLGVIIAATVVVWTCGLAANVLVLTAAGITPSLDLAGRMIIAGYLIGLAPAPPVRLGVYEAGMVAALATGGVALPEALVVAITLHVCQLAELGLLAAVSVPMARFRASG